MNVEGQRNLVRLIDQCKNIKHLKQIHGQIITSPYLSTIDHTSLISRLLFFSTTTTTLSQHTSLSYSSRIFQLTPNPNLFMYNALIRAYASKIDTPTSSNSLILYKDLLVTNLSPDSITLPFVLKECGKRRDVFSGRSVHAHAVKFGLCRSVYVNNSLMNLYSECGDLWMAWRVFDEMLDKDIVSWNTIIIGCVRKGELNFALNLFRRMDKKNIITWNSIITGAVQCGRPKEALMLFHEMQVLASNVDVIKPDKITIASVLSACASLGAIDQGKWVHNYLTRSGLECDMVIKTGLVDMYGKCGCIDKAVKVFNGMSEKDVLAWTAMISVFSLHGYDEEAFKVFNEMEKVGVKPNAITFVGLLTSCAHSGKVEKGRWCFDLMKHVYGIEPLVQHYACLVDLLGRAGLFDEAERVIENMPMDPDVYVWGALLGGCQMHRNVELGEKVAKYLINLEPSNHAFYVNLCDLYAKAGRFDEFERVRGLMNDLGIKKIAPGCSMIEVDGVVMEFSVNGLPQLHVKEITSVLSSLCSDMKIEGDFSLYLG